MLEMTRDSLHENSSVQPFLMWASVVVLLATAFACLGIACNVEKDSHARNWLILGFVLFVATCYTFAMSVYVTVAR